MNKTQPSESIISPDFIIWSAAGVMGYSLIVPLFAFESMMLAESAMRFSLLHQLVILLLIVSGSISVFAKLITQGWQNRHLLTVIAVSLLLISVQPAAECCTSLVAAISGFAPLSEIRFSDILFHVLPIIGSSLLVLNALREQRGTLKKISATKV